MAKTAYEKVLLTGGGATALDGIDGATLLDGDFCFVFKDGVEYDYILDDDASLAENSPYVIVPDVAPTTKCWLLQATPWDLALITNPKAMAQAIWQTAGATASMSRADATSLNFGTGNCVIGGHFCLPDWTPAANQILIQKLTGGVGYQLEVVAATGIIRLTLNATAYNSSVAPTNAVDGTWHKIIPVVTVGAVNTTVDFYFDGKLLGTQQTAANPGTTTSAALLYILGTSAVRYAGGVNEIYLFNLAPTAAEVLDLYRNGIPESWKWGSQTSIVTGDDSTFASDTGFWLKSAGTVTIADGVCHYINALGYAFIRSPIVIVGKRYKVIYTIKNYVNGVIKTGGATFYDSGYSANGTYTIEFVSDHGYFYFYAFGAATTLDIDDVTLVEIGADLALEPEGIQQDKWYDSSLNGLDTSYPSTGYSFTRQLTKRVKQPTPTAETVAVTLTIAKLLTGIITGTHAVGATQAYTLPTGTLCDAGGNFGINSSFDWTIINLSAAVADTITVTSPGADHTIVGNPIVQSANAASGGIWGNSATFRTRKTAANTFITYRVA